MKAAVVHGPGQKPQYTGFPDPTAGDGEQRIHVHAAALTHLTKGRASGAHYSADSIFPAVVGVDGVGVTQDGRRVYFILPEAPNGALAEITVVPASRCIPLPDTLDDITAAALANPGMSAWAALVERAHLQPGETVLINGATGIAGRLAVQIAKHLGAAKVIATARNAKTLEELRQLGADTIIPFDLEATPEARNQFESALKQEFRQGIDVVVDYLWGPSAETLITAIAKAVDDARPVRFVNVGGASGGDIQLPAAALRSSSIVLMGSGLKSVPLPTLLASIQHVFAAAGPANLRIDTQPTPLAEVTAAWDNETKSRIVFTLP